MKTNKLIQPLVVTISAIFMLIATAAGFGLIGTPVEDSAGGSFSADATLITPDSPAFSIWSLVYIGLIAYVVWQWIQRDNETASRIGWYAAASMVLNGMWLGVTQLGWIWPSVVVLITLALVLGVILRRLNNAQHRSRLEKVVVNAPLVVTLDG